MLRSFILVALLSCSFYLQAQRKTEKSGRLSDHFGKETKRKEKKQLSSPFSKPNSKKIKPTLLASFYSKAISKAADHSQLPSFFNTKLQKEKKRTQQLDFFAKERPVKKGTKTSDYFAKEKKQIIRKESDLELNSKTKTIHKKNFIGEKKRFFNKEPNKKTENTSKRKDPFGRKKKDAPQFLPKGEKDLFGNGVLPKMKDMR